MPGKVLDKDAIEKSARLDGYYAIQTSEKKIVKNVLISSIMIYGRLEESFRIMRNNLEVRPMFTGHLKEIKVISLFVSLHSWCKRELEFRMRRRNTHFSRRYNNER